VHFVGLCYTMYDVTYYIMYSYCNWSLTLAWLCNITTQNGGGFRLTNGGIGIYSR